MRRTVLILILAAAAALAQNATKKASAKVPAKTAGQSPTAATKKKTVGPTETVITIHGLCDSSTKGTAGSKARACATVLTRREFEAFVDTLNATMTRGIDSAYYRGVAEAYTTLVVSSEAGQKTGADKDPRFEQVLDLNRMRALGGMYRSQKFQEALQVPAEEIEAYYHKNIDGFEEVDLDRFLLPKNNPENLGDEAFRAKAKLVAEELRARAVKGEDIAKLEKEGLESLKLKDTSLPAVAVGVRRGQVEEKAEKEIFALGQGDVTPVLDERALWMFFKRTGRLTLSLDTVGPEIRTKLFREKLDTIDKTLHDAVKVDYNEAYFGPAPNAAKAAAEAPAKASESPAKTEDKSAAPAEVAAGDTVLTIHGLCGSHKTDAVASSCTLEITREQFDPVFKLALLSPSKTLASPRSAAESYIDDLIYGEAGARAHVEKDPRYAGVMKMARQRALTDMYHLRMYEEAHEIPPDDIEAYYKKNLAGFDEAKLSVISIPKQSSAKSHDAEFAAKAKRLASELRERAAKGDDVDKLQKEAYQELGVKDVPATSMNPLRRGSFEEKTGEQIFALKPGEVTRVVEVPSAYVIYKLESQRTIPLEEAKAEISYLFFREKLEKLSKAATASIRAEYNDNYFGSAPSNAWTSAGTQAKAATKPLSSK